MNVHLLNNENGDEKKISIWDWGMTKISENNENAYEQQISIPIPEPNPPIYAFDGYGKRVDISRLPAPPKKSKRAYRRMMKKMEKEARRWEGYEDYWEETNDEDTSIS